MRYQEMQGNCVNAIYSREQGNPYLEALPDVLGKKEFERKIKSQPDFPKDVSRLAPEDGSVKKFVSLEENDSFLVRITI